MIMSHDRTDLFEGFTLDLERGSLRRGYKLVHLRPQTYEVLKCLLNNRGHLISKDQLINEVWKGRAVTDGSLGKCIEELREALGLRPGSTSEMFVDAAISSRRVSKRHLKAKFFRPDRSRLRL